MMMTALAERVFVPVKIPDQLVIFNITGQGLYNFSMRQFHRSIQVHQCLYLDIFRNIRLGKGFKGYDFIIKAVNHTEFKEIPGDYEIMKLN